MKSAPVKVDTQNDLRPALSAASCAADKELEKKRTEAGARFDKVGGLVIVDAYTALDSAKAQVSGVSMIVFAAGLTSVFLGLISIGIASLGEATNKIARATKEEDKQNQQGHGHQSNSGYSSGNRRAANP